MLTRLSSEPDESICAPLHSFVLRSGFGIGNDFGIVEMLASVQTSAVTSSTNPNIILSADHNQT